jgi:hypothetical protein
MGEVYCGRDNGITVRVYASSGRKMRSTSCAKQSREVAIERLPTALGDDAASPIAAFRVTGYGTAGTLILQE